MKRVFNNKKKVLIILFITLFILFCISAGNIYKNLKAEVSLVNTSSQITEEKIKNMTVGSILGEVKSTYNDGYEYISFYSDNEEPTKYALMTIDNALSKKYEVKVVLKFGINSQKKEARITLARGVEFSDYGNVALASDLEEFIPNTGTNNILGTSYNTFDGTSIYKFKDGVETVTIKFTVKPDIVLDMGKIQKAITVDLYEDGSKKSSSYLNIDADMSNHPIMINGTNFSINGSSYPSYPKTRVAGLYTYNESLGGSRNCLFKYIRITYEVPDNVVYDDTIAIYGGAASSTMKFNLKEGYPKDNKFVFEINNFYGSFAGINASWAFPEESFENGQEVEVKVTKLEYETYNGDVVSTDGKYYVFNSSKGKAVEKEGNFSYSVKYTILQNEKIEFSNVNELNVYSVNKDKINEEAMLGYFHFINNSSVPSSSKDIIYYFSDEIGISEINVPIFDTKDGSINVYYKTDNNNDDWIGPVKLAYGQEEYNSQQFLIDKDDLGLEENEYISALKYNVGIIPGNFNKIESLNTYSYYGKVKSTDELPSSYNAIIHVVEADSNSSDLSKCEKNCHQKTYKFNYDTKYLNIYFKPNETKIIEAGKTEKFEYVLQHNSSSSFFRDSFVYNPIIYVRDETGLGLTNFKLKTYSKENKVIDFTNEVSIDLVKEEADGTLVYKIDTTKVSNNKALVGYYGHRLNMHAKRIYLSYDLNVPATYTDGSKIHNFKDTVFVTASDFDFVNSHIAFNEGDLYDVDSDNITTDDNMTYMKTSNYYKIDSALDINASIEQKQEDELEYIYWQESADDLFIDQDKIADLKLIIKNDSGVTANESIIYLPIPKKGQNWGILSNNEEFKFSMNLVDLIELDDSNVGKLEISYGTIEPTSNIENIQNIQNWDDTISKEKLNSYNMIKISIDDFEASKEKRFKIKLSLSEKQLVKQRQQFSFAIYRNLTTKDNQVISSYKYGNNIGISTLLAKFNLTTIYKDIYNFELDKLVEKKEYNSQYETIAKEIDGYELFLEPSNKKGVILNDTIVEYVYKSLEERKVIVHYYEKGTKNKLKEDKIIIGKDLEQFEIKSEEIDGYKLVEDKVIKGAFKKDVQEFEFLYEKKISVVPVIPSTIDTIIYYIIMFIISAISVIGLLLYINKNKES